MASLIFDKKSGRKRIQFFLMDDKRLSIGLGKMTAKQAQTVHSHVEHLIAAKLSGSAPENYTCQWLAQIDNRLHAKLASHGLTRPRTVVPS